MNLFTKEIRDNPTAQKRVLDLANALESGEYKQGYGALRSGSRKDGYEFCCLGVACDKYDNTQWKPLAFDDNISDFIDNYSKLPVEVQTAYCFASQQGSFRIDPIWSSLIGLNDDEKKTFKDIAAIIRKELALVLS